jgi:para-aminobenzoate synthetase component 1
MIQYLNTNSFEINKLRAQFLELSKKYEIFSILDSNHWQFDTHKSYDLLAAFGSVNNTIADKSTNSFDALKREYNSRKDWIFTYLSYDIKNELEQLHSDNLDSIQAPNIQYFIPKLLFLIKDDQLNVFIHEDYQADKDIIADIEKALSNPIKEKERKLKTIEVKHRISREEYLKVISKIRNHIKQGDVYELNYCQEFYSENTEIEPSLVFKKLISKSPTPFSAFVRFNEIFILSASPERFIKKEGNRIVSQPIKGTSRRHADTLLDIASKKDLANNEKERAENIMIVDLVRNDLSHTAKKGSVHVDELCKIYSFKQVHQMISTISSELDEKYDFIDVLKTTFPMGSMTGAPKIRAMQLIEQYEQTKRGIYSGAIGYITPDGDFDFNVVIRSLIYNQENKYLSFIAGGAITYQSNPEKEYAESLLKAEAIREILS